ncbi:MAG: hypothetical protein B7W98_02315, partial [Parcubacteria group bacterium 20-58-5]
MTLTLERLLSFFSFTNRLYTTERVARTPGTARYANTGEHSLQVALVAWYVLDAYQLPLDHEKVLKYALAHDSPEAYAGDAYIYDAAARSPRERLRKRLGVDALRWMRNPPAGEVIRFPMLLTIRFASGLPPERLRDLLDDFESRHRAKREFYEQLGEEGGYYEMPAFVG